MRYILTIIFIFFTGCSDVGDVKDSSSAPKDIEKNITETNTTDLNESIKEIDENKTVEDEKNSTKIVFQHNEPYTNQFQPSGDTDPDAPIYIPPVEPEKEYLNGKELKILSGDIKQDKLLSKTYYWKISGEVRVLDGSRLSIEEGTTLFGEDKNSILSFEDGSELIALGKKSEPIIFTSEFDILDGNPKAGDWGGIVLNSSQTSILKYAQIRYAGYNRPALKLENMGFESILEFVQIYISHSDGIELNGGKLNLRNIIILGANGDSLSLKNSWNGNLQNIYIHQFEDIFGERSSGLEIASDIKDSIITNITILSDVSDVGAGIYLRGESEIQIVNSIITGKRSSVCLKAELLSTKHIFESNVLGNCSDGHLLKIKLDSNLNYLTSENRTLKEFSKKVEPINPASFGRFDDYPELYIGSFNFNLDKKWSDSWSIGMEDILGEK